MNNWLDEFARVTTLITRYEKGTIALTNVQQKQMWSIFNEIKGKCPHDGKVEQHFKVYYRDEYDVGHSEISCQIECAACTEVLKAPHHINNGCKCFFDGSLHRKDNFHQFNVFIEDKTRARYAQKHFITQNTYYWVTKVEEAEVIPPPPVKPDYLSKLEELEKVVNE